MARIFKFLRIGSAALLGGLITSGLGYILITGYFGFGEKLVNRSYNLTVTLPRFFESPTLADEVMIVYMDDESYAQLRQNENLAFNRSIHAALLERLSMDGAKAAVFDVIFDNETPSADIHPVPPGLGFEDADQYFVSVMTNRFPNVVLGADQVEIGKTREGAGGVEYVTPIEALDLACGDIGNVYLEADSDLIVRRHKRYLEEDFVHTLSVAAAQMIDAPVVKNAELMNEEKWINYYGPPVTLPAVSYYQAVDFSICKPGFFKNKVVFIGARILTTKATERKDAYPSPFSYWMQNRSRSYSIGEDGEWVLTKKADLFMPGVEIQATMFLNLIRQDWLRRIDKDDEGQAIILLGLLFGIALTQVRPLVASMLAAVSFVGLLGFSYFLLKETNSWFAWTIVALEIGFAYV